MEIDRSKLSPMMRQYFEVKDTLNDTILMYRLGDFYEMFFDDAELVSRELELTLTGRDCGLEQRAPMCGVPYHSVQGYLAKLIANGHKVAICEQTEDPAKAKGLVRREIIRVVSPGTVIDDDMLSEASNNYIASLFVGDGGYGLCFADISTGSVDVTEGDFDAGVILGEFSRFAPSEVIYNAASVAADPQLSALLRERAKIFGEQLYDGYFQLETAKSFIMKQYAAAELKKIAAMKRGLAVRSLGALTRYLQESQKTGAARMVELSGYRPRQYMGVSAAARRNLELTETMMGRERRGSLLWVLDRTKTPMGRRLLKTYIEKPLLDVAEIDARLDACTELFADSVQCAKIQDALGGVFDLERLMTKVVYGTCTPRELRALAASAQNLRLVKNFTKSFKCAFLRGADRRIDALDDIRQGIEKTIEEQPPALMKEGGYIRGGCDANVDELRDIVRNTKKYLATLEQKLRDETGIKQLKIGYNRVFGYYIEVSKGSVPLVPQSFVRKQTIASGERYITEDLKQLEDKINGASERLLSLEREIFEQLREQIARQLALVQQTARAVAELDVACGFADVSLRNNYCRPRVNDSDRVEIIGGRHPVVERLQSSELFVPNDCLLDGVENLINIVTGPNMAGKSTFMRQTALIVLMAQIGCFVPANSANIGIVDSIFTRVGASDDIFSGRSTFMVEMNEVAEILQNATPKSLLILDEIGRGTSTYDGMSIARAVLEYIDSNLKCKTIFATHYHELTDMQSESAHIKNYNIAAKKRGDDILFLRRIVCGPADDSYGIEVAKLAGVPQPVIDRAKEILARLDSDTGAPRAPRVYNRAEISEPERAALSELKSLSVENLTPIEAMYKLDELINKVNGES